MFVAPDKYLRPLYADFNGGNILVRGVFIEKGGIEYEKIYSSG